MQRRGVALRVTGLLLAALFLGGVGGASDLDALFYHTGGGAHAAPVGPHYEPAGAPNHHADHCLLTFRTHSGRRAAALPSPLRLAESPRHAAARPDDSPDRFDPAQDQDSRAPPAALA